MGKEQSKPTETAEPPKPVLLEDPWRTFPEKQEILHFLGPYKPKNKQVTRLRILLHGPVGAGKSSFINSVNSVFQGRVSGRALTDATSGSSFTTKYKTYKIQNDSGGFYPFIFNDIMGFEENKGVRVEDVKLALMGHVREGYQFNPERYLMEGDMGYNSHPTLEDRVHVLITVVPLDKLSILSDEMVKKMRDVRLAASGMEIPQLAILTKPDEACPEVKKDIKNLYKSVYLKELVEKFHKLVGHPVNCIFPVKNYSSEISTTDDMDAQMLIALRQIIMYGEDFLNNLPNQPDC